jgi:hypothetical protein
VESPNPKTKKHGKINIISNPKLVEKEFGFMNIFKGNLKVEQKIIG